jgi:hypothetical protein
MASTRILVERSISESFIKLLVEKTNKLKLGDVRDMDTAYGPVINQRALDKVWVWEARCVLVLGREGWGWGAIQWLSECVSGVCTVCLLCSSGPLDRC